jgi:hypothetical protein
MFSFFCFPLSFWPLGEAFTCVVSNSPKFLEDVDQLRKLRCSMLVRTVADIVVVFFCLLFFIC